MNSRSEARIQLRVRYEETDQMGVVYYGNYFTWFEIARTEYFRKNGFIYRDMEKENELFLPVIDAHCRYKKSLEYDDLIDIWISVEKVTNTSVSFVYNISLSGELVADGSTRHVFIDKNKKPVPIPKSIREFLDSEAS